MLYLVTLSQHPGNPECQEAREKGRDSDIEFTHRQMAKYAILFKKYVGTHLAIRLKNEVARSRWVLI